MIAFNKWDLLDEDRREQLEREIDRDFARVAWAPRVNVSAKTGRAVERLAGHLRTSLASWDRRIPTGRLNSWLGEVVAQTPPPPRGGKAPRVLFATQADIRPPRFVLFTTGFLEAGLPPLHRAPAARGLRLRPARPIEISVRVREKRGAPRAVPADATSDSPRCDRVVAARHDRDVAQLGSALDWGSRGRRFKSCRPDRSWTRSRTTVTASGRSLERRA